MDKRGKSNNLLYFMGAAIIILLSILIILNLSKNTSENNTLVLPKCQGAYIEYQGNCCLDNNYNNICDSLENKQPQDNGVALNTGCGAFQPCAFDKWDYLGDGEICQQSCENGQCVLRNCQIGGCGRGTSITCRSGAVCDSLSNTCSVLPAA